MNLTTTRDARKEESVLSALPVTIAAFFELPASDTDDSKEKAGNATSDISTKGPTKVFVDMHSTTTTEDGTSDGPYHLIQDAVDNATSGDTVVVLDGKYTEDVTIDKELSLQADNLKASTIMGSVMIHASNVSIQAFVIDGDASPDDAAGIRITTSADATFSGTAQIIGNEIKHFKQGIRLDFKDPENNEAVLIRWDYIHRNDIGINAEGSIGDAAIEITNNNIKYNDNGIGSAGTGVMVNHNNILVNVNGFINYADSKQNAKYNWWGGEEGPSITNKKKNSVTTDTKFPDGSVDYSPWLCDSIEYNPGNSVDGCDNTPREM